MTCRSERAAGFTLVELLVVLVILGLVAGIVGPQVMKHVGSSKTKTTYLQIEELASALEMYKLELDAYPSTDQGLGALVQKPSGVEKWNGPYLRKAALPKDPWGRDYRYRHPGQHTVFDLYSLGADNAEGGDGENADVVNWK
jgi:general secretion pathway protein G